MEAVLAEIRRVAVIGSSLSFVLPSSFARLLGVTPETAFYVYLDGGSIVYSPDPPEGKRYAVVKARVQARFREHRYYVLTIPRPYAQHIGIDKGDAVNIKLEEGKIILNRYPR